MTRIKIRTVAALAGLFLGGITAARAGEYVGTLQRYVVDFSMVSPLGPPHGYSTFTAPTGLTVSYEPFTFDAGSPLCIELGAVSLDSTDQIIWYQDIAGKWNKLADDVIGRDPHAVLYLDGAITMNLRLANYYPGTTGRFFVMTNFVQPVPPQTYEAWCDGWATYKGWPYMKVKGSTIAVSGVR